MSITADLILHAHFHNREALLRVKRYLLRKGRVALAEDVPAPDQEAYRYIETLEYGSSRALSANTLQCGFSFDRIEDYDDEVSRIFAVFRQLEAHQLLGVVITEQEEIVYAGLEDDRVALLVFDRSTREKLDHAGSKAILAAAAEILAHGRALVSKRGRSRAPKNPEQPVLIKLPCRRPEHA